MIEPAALLRASRFLRIEASAAGTNVALVLFALWETTIAARETVGRSRFQRLQRVEHQAHRPGEFIAEQLMGSEGAPFDTRVGLIPVGNTAFCSPDRDGNWFTDTKTGYTPSLTKRA